MSSKEQTHSNDKASSRHQSRQPGAESLDIRAHQQLHPATIIQRAALDPKSLTPHNVLRLQRTIGNQAVGRLLAGMGPRQSAAEFHSTGLLAKAPDTLPPTDIQRLQHVMGNPVWQRVLAGNGPSSQPGGTHDTIRRSRPALIIPQVYQHLNTARTNHPKLQVGPAGDKYEQEADRVAEQVMTMPAAQTPPRQSSVQRAAPEEQEVQTKPLAATITPLVRRQAEEEEVQSKPLVQRKIEHQFRGHVGFFAGIFRSHDKAFQKILAKYKLYQKAQTVTEESKRLTEIANQCQTYLANYLGDNPRKDQDAKELLVACQTELDTIRRRQEAERNPLLTKKTGGRGTLKKGATLYMDAQLAQEFKYTLESLDCEIAGDYATQGAYLVRVWSVQAGKMIAWVKKADMAQVTDPQKIERQPDLKYVTINPTAPLFPQDPSIKDVQQGGIGDCYLLAAVLTVVNRNPNLIRSIMDDKGATVTAHLYDIKSGQPKSFVPRDVTIDKSVVVNKSNMQAYAQNSLWVQMLEKAYAAAGYTGLDTAPIGDVSSFGDIACGLASVALEHLLGKPGEMSMQDIQTGIGVNVDLRPKNVTRLPWSDAEKAAHKLALNAKDKKTAYAGLVSYNILGATDRVDEWMTSIDKVNVEQEVIEIARKGDKTYKGAEIRLEDFAQMFKDKGIKRSIAKDMVTWLEAKQLYPGKRGTGRYTGHQTELFGKIKTALDGKGYAVVASKLVVARGKPTGTGHSGGEAIAKGLVGGHAYAVLGYGYGPDHNSAEDQNDPHQLRWVRLRNPWGQYGRKYIKQSGKLKAKEVRAAPETWLELSDLTKRYAWIETVQG